MAYHRANSTAQKQLIKQNNKYTLAKIYKKIGIRNSNHGLIKEDQKHECIGAGQIDGHFAGVIINKQNGSNKVLLRGDGKKIRGENIW